MMVIFNLKFGQPVTEPIRVGHGTPALCESARGVNGYVNSTLPVACQTVFIFKAPSSQRRPNSSPHPEGAGRCPPRARPPLPSQLGSSTVTTSTEYLYLME